MNARRLKEYSSFDKILTTQMKIKRAIKDATKCVLWLQLQLIISSAEICSVMNYARDELYNLTLFSLTLSEVTAKVTTLDKVDTSCHVMVFGP